ncbi:enoyl-CoA hydratase/isomerase family protein [Ferrovibrio terrae]|uniref:Enoyl-CoA hydratase/isomerase family protein n=1 Tax=Ferrovibrio terrae TaxID=2594003 RepID=A0A516H6Y1_9PROT|nr:enoyl-CoA hydratase-related protein [Ferrovibrio terrae]QDO99470.1 enoyl-CoA hydratase/isomerase family protein [Ferrovibrio terrae]
MSQAFLAEIQGSLAAITFCRPEKHNALEIGDLEALDSTLIGLAGRSDIRTLVLSAQGKSFCAGVDFGAVAGHDWRDNPLERVSDRLETMPFPTLCVLQGGVYGGGTDLALACDFRLGARGIRSFIPPAKLGIQYHPHGLKRAVTRLGLGPAKRLFLATETFDDAEMLRTGFLDWLVEAEALTERAQALAATLSALAPQAVRGMKQSLNEIADSLFDERAARDRAAASFRTEDFLEGRAAMTEKRPPQFKGN